MSGLRSRSRNDYQSTSVTVTNSNVFGIQSFTRPGSIQGEASSITEMCTDGWLEAIAQGQIIMGEMTLTKEKRTAGSAFHRMIYPQNFVDETLVGDLTAYVQTAAARPSTSADPVDEAWIRGLAQVDAMSRANQGDMYSGESIAQLGTTIRMLRSPLKGVNRLLNKMIFRRAKLHELGTGNILKATQDAWLEGRYGFKPLMFDIESIASALMLNPALQKRRLVVRATQNWSSTTETGFAGVRLGGDFNHYRATGSYTKKVLLRANAGIIIDLEPMSLEDNLLRVFGFRCRDLPSTLWALVPFSFVVDWFFNFDKWLQAFLPAPQVVVKATWNTLVSEVSVSCNEGTLVRDPLYTGYPSTYGVYGASVESKTIIRRSPNPFTMVPPMLTGKPLSLTHSIDAMALLSQSALTGLDAMKH